MASILRIKRSELVGNPSILAAGELAYSAANPGITAGGGRLYIGTGTETNYDAANHVVIGGKYFTDIIDAATNLGTNNTLVKRDGTNTAYLNIIGNVTGSVSGGITGDVTGNVTGNVTSTGTSSFNNVNVNGAITGAAVGNVIPFYYANQTAFPSATTYDGALAHSHADGRMYFAHSGVWLPLANSSDATSQNTANKTVTRDASGNFVAGTITAALTGNVTGNVVGDVTGNLTGNSAGVHTGNVVGDVTGNLTGNSAGVHTGNVVGNVTGNLSGNSAGVHTGNVVGNVTGNLTGNSAGVHTGNVVGNVTGNSAGVHTGNVVGDVTGNLTGNVTGNVTGNASTASAWLTPRNLSLTGDATATLANVSGAGSVSAAITLATVNSNIGSFGSATAIPVVTVNAKGLITAVTTANIATTLSIAGSTGAAGGVSLLSDTLTFAAGSGLKTSFNDTTNTLLLELEGSAQLSALTLTGALSANALTISTTLTAGNTTVTDIQVNGNAIVTGNLTVNGTVTAINSTTVTIADKNIELAKNANTAILSDGGGLTVGTTLNDFTAATLTYSAINDRWNFNKDLAVSNVYGALKGNADTASAWSNSRTVSFSGADVSGSFGINGSQNVSAVALTLANVNSNSGSYGDSVTVPNFTVNAKGLITAVSSTAIPNATISVKGLASFDSTQFTVTAGAVTISTVDGGSY